MEFYRSAVDLVMGSATTENDRKLVSPSSAFESGYVPLTFAPIDQARDATNVYVVPPAGLGDIAENTSVFPAEDTLSAYGTTESASHTTGSLDYNYTTIGEPSEDWGLPSPLNLGESPSPPLPPRVPPNSPANDGALSFQQLLPVPSHPPMQNRRPGRPRGGRLSDAEEYYRALAQMNHDQARSTRRMTGLNPSLNSLPGVAALVQDTAPVLGGVGGTLGYNMDGAATQGLDGGAGADFAEFADALAQYPLQLDFQNQQQTGPAENFGGIYSHASGGQPSQQPAQPAAGPSYQHLSGSTVNNQFSASTNLGGFQNFPGQSQLVSQPPLRPTAQAAAPFPSAFEQAQLPHVPRVPMVPMIPTAPVAAVLHDLPASVTKRPSFQRILQQTTDPTQLPADITPEQAQLIQNTHIHAAKVKFDKVRMANNKSAKRGRFKRMAATVALADEVLRLKANMARLEREKEELEEKLEMVEGVMPGITGLNEVQHALASPFFGGGGVKDSPVVTGYGTVGAGGKGGSAVSGTAGLGISLPAVDMTDLFGSPTIVPTSETREGSTTRSDAFGGLALPNAAGAEDEVDTEDLVVDRSFITFAHATRRELIKAVRKNELHELGFGCHDQIDAVVQRGRQIRHLLGVADEDWDHWVPSPATMGRRRRAASEFVEEVGEDETRRTKNAKKGKRVAGKA